MRELDFASEEVENDSRVSEDAIADGVSFGSWQPRAILATSDDPCNKCVCKTVLHKRNSICQSSNNYGSRE